MVNGLNVPLKDHEKEVHVDALGSPFRVSDGESAARNWQDKKRESGLNAMD